MKENDNTKLHEELAVVLLRRALIEFFDDMMDAGEQDCFYRLFWWNHRCRVETLTEWGLLLEEVFHFFGETDPEFALEFVFKSLTDTKEVTDDEEEVHV
jgi:hypothetical protein